MQASLFFIFFYFPLFFQIQFFLQLHALCADKLFSFPYPSVFYRPVLQQRKRLWRAHLCNDLDAKLLKNYDIAFLFLHQWLPRTIKARRRDFKIFHLLVYRVKFQLLVLFILYFALLALLWFFRNHQIHYLLLFNFRVIIIIKLEVCLLRLMEYWLHFIIPLLIFYIIIIFISNIII